MSKLNPKITLKNFLVGIIILLIVLGAWWFINQRYQKKMVKLDACLESCIGKIDSGVGGGLLTRGSILQGCREECREKYGITWEEYNKWKNK